VLLCICKLYLLISETNLSHRSGAVLAADICSNPSGSGEPPTVPEELGQLGAARLLEEIYRGGCADSTSQSLTALLMALGPPDVSKMLVGPLSPYTVQFLRHTRDFFQLMFKLETQRPAEEEDRELAMGSDKVLMTCVGIGYTNLSKRTT
jgi:RNA 3'-terminal phosphate cyclase-like protein